MPWNMAPPPTSFSSLPQIQQPTQQAPDPGTQMNALATGNAQRQLMAQQTQDAATQNAQNQIKLQEMQQDQADMQTFRGFYRQYNGDMGQALDAATRAGVGPNVIQPIRTAIQTYQQGQANLTDKQREVGNLNNDGMHALLLPVQKITNPADQEAAYNQTMQAGVSKGYIQQSDIGQHPYAGQAGLDSYVAGLNTVKWMTEDAAQKQAAARQTTADAGKAKEDAELPGQQADAAQKQRANVSAQLSSAPDAATYDQIRDASSMAAQFPPSRLVFDPTGKQWLPGQQAAVNRVGMNSEQKTQADQAAANAKQNAQPKTEAELSLAAVDPNGTDESRGTATAALSKFTQSQRAAHPPSTNTFVIPGLPASGQPASQLTGEDFLKSLPGATAAQIKFIDEGRGPMPSANSRAPGAAQLRAAVLQYDPGFDEANTNNRFQTLREFNNTSTSHAGGQVLALNTLVHHADLYMQVADGLKNGTFQPGNALYNQVATTFGSAPPTQANLVARFFAAETGKVASGGVPAEGEINGILKSLGSDASPDQIKAAGQSLLQIAGGKMIPLQEKVTGAKLDNVVHVLGPDAKDILTRRGFDPNTMKPAGQNPNPSGGSGYVRTSTGAGGDQIGQTSDGKWHDVKTGAVIQ